MMAGRTKGRRHPRQSWWRGRTLTRGGLLLSPSWLCTLAFFLGLMILLSGPVRFGGPSFTVQRAIMPWWAWGWVFVAYGILLIGSSWFSHRHNDVVALGSFLYGFWGVTFLISLFNQPLASGTGAVVYLWLAATHARLAVAIKALPNQGALFP